nr:dual specificity protein phosphatase [Ferrimicrobium acidiphilum]
METQITDNLYLGDYGDSEKWLTNKLGRVICVMTEELDPLEKDRIWLPILDMDCRDHTIDDIKCKANVKALEAVSNSITMLISNGERVLVHCGMGKDRSPLAVAWYLHKENGISLTAAYEQVKAKRSIVQPHLNWVPSIEVDGSVHFAGDGSCYEGWCGGSYGYPKLCTRQGCEGLVHAEFGDENPDCDYWLYTKCDIRGEPEPNE